MIRGPFIRNRDTDPATCNACGRVVTRGDLYGVARRHGPPVTGVCHQCAARAAARENRRAS